MMVKPRAIFHLIVLISVVMITACQQTQTSTEKSDMFVISDSPITLEPSLCAGYETQIERIGCYDLFSKYNQNETICDFIEQTSFEQTQNSFVQTKNNCVAQLQQSRLFAKGIITNNTPIESIGAPSTMNVNDMEHKITIAQRYLKETAQCSEKKFCIFYPSASKTEYYAVCLCIN